MTGADEHVSERAELGAVAAEHRGGRLRGRSGARGFPPAARPVARTPARRRRPSLWLASLRFCWVCRAPRIGPSRSPSSVPSGSSSVRYLTFNSSKARSRSARFSTLDRLEVESRHSHDQLARNAERVHGGQPGEREPLDLCRREDRRHRLLQLDDLDQVGGFGRLRPLGLDALRGQVADGEQRYDDEGEQARSERSTQVASTGGHTSLSAPCKGS